MTTLPVSADGQAIALACSTLALQRDSSLKPLTATEWHQLSLALQASQLRPRDLVGLSPFELRDTLRLSKPMAERVGRLLSRGGQLAFEVERLSSRGIWIVTRADETYPSALKQRLHAQTPPLLFGAGQQGGLQLAAIAIVGSRDVNEQGLAFASSLGRRCAEQGFAVVSGAARGVDLAAMTGALSHGGAAIGVTVDPLEKLLQRRELRHAIADDLLTLATPFHPSARWHPGNAMRRNRLVYALARAAVVVASSAEKGGTRAGARENLEAAWGVPLHVRDDGSPGNRRLIADGAIPLRDNESLDELNVERLTGGNRPTLLDPNDEPAAKRPGVNPAKHDSGTPPSRLGSDDLFLATWPILAQHLQEPITERDLAERLELELTQARAWLKRAVAEGLAEVKPRPKRYVLRATDSEQLRIDDAGRD